MYSTVPGRSEREEQHERAEAKYNLGSKYNFYFFVNSTALRSLGAYNTVYVCEPYIFEAFALL